jgi:DNA-binding transcriptional ArsR family regulator
MRIAVAGDTMLGRGVAKTLEADPPAPLFDPPVAVFKALADATRRAILDELMDRTGQTLFEICSRLATKQFIPAGDRSISMSEAAGFVTTRRGSSKRLLVSHNQSVEHVSGGTN